MARKGLITPGKIIKDVMCTHIFDWSSKCRRLETHLAKGILMQKNDLVDGLANVTLEPKYEFSRKVHRSFKGSSVDLPQINVNQSKVKLFKSVHHIINTKHPKYRRVFSKNFHMDSDPLFVFI